MRAKQLAPKRNERIYTIPPQGRRAGPAGGIALSVEAMPALEPDVENLQLDRRGRL